MSSKKALYLYFSLLVLVGIVIGYTEAQGVEPPRIINLLFMVLTTVSIYLWYYHDAKERSYPRSTLLGGAILMFSVVAIPFYLFKSREPGKRAGAVAKYFGCIFLTLAIPVITAIPISMLSTPAETPNPSFQRTASGGR